LFSTNELLSGGSTFILKEHAILEVKQIATFTNWANTIQGSDGEADYALARLKEVVSQGHNGITYNNKVEVECSYHTSNKTFYTLNPPARMVREGESTVDIPATECNDGGNNNVAPGTPANPVFPIIYEGAGLTYLFEDNWPYLGDYDMNDLVLDVQPTYSLNSSNNVTELKLDVTLRAVGATKRLAVGIQLDGISSEAISTVSRTNTAGINGNVFTQSNGLETGQEFAVIPVFDDAHQALGHSSPLITNTVKGSANNVSPARVIFTIDFSNNPLDQADITVDKFNVFIINGGYSAKRSEVHMAGFQPTGKADKGRFGFADSDSNENPYKSENNMIWGLAIPGPAKYPVEWSSITESYLALELWAKSGGSENKDWYKSPVGNKIYE
jgi:LruC domain-containing protein